jgi:hypothetical protein
MPDDPPVTAPPDPSLYPADPADVMQALAFALRYRGRKRVDTAGEAMARITAERLVEHLRASGFVVMQRPAASPPAADYVPPR